MYQLPVCNNKYDDIVKYNKKSTDREKFWIISQFYLQFTVPLEVLCLHFFASVDLLALYFEYRYLLQTNQKYWECQCCWCYMYWSQKL